MEIVHHLTAATLIEQLQSREVEHPAVFGKDGEVVKEAWVETIHPSPAVIQAAAKFLKDNSIFSTPEQSAALAELQAKLAATKNARKPTAQDTADALAAFGGKQLQ